MGAYETGLDILGAVGVARSAVNAMDASRSGAASKYKGAANKIIAVGQRISRRNAKLGAAFVAAGNAHSRRADKAAKKPVEVTPAAAKKLVAQKPASLTPAAAKAVMSTAAVRPTLTTRTISPTAIKTALRRAVVMGDLMSTGQPLMMDPRAGQLAVERMIGEATAVANLGAFLDATMIPLYEQLSKSTNESQLTLADEGAKKINHIIWSLDSETRALDGAY